MLTRSLPENMSRHKTKAKSRKAFFAVTLAIAVTLMVASLTLIAQGRKVCVERWECSDWGACSNGVQQRACADLNSCNTLRGKPDTSQACGKAVGTSTVKGNIAPPGSSCGDGKCIVTESCSSCPSDCGKCAGVVEGLTEVKKTMDSAATEVANLRIYTEPLGMEAADDLMEQGYVIIRYYYAPNCDACKEPVDIEAELRDLASRQSDMIALTIINRISFPFDAERYAGVQGVVYPPSIRVDGISDGTPGYGLLFGYSLVQNLQDGDLMNDLGPLVCEHSDRCEFKGGKIVRT